MRLAFTKMHGIGNDYVFIDTLEQEITAPSGLARRLSDRHLGVGGDGLILVRPPVSADCDCRMEIYNADGSRAEMCGNGLRCVGRFVYERGMARREVLKVETDAGVKELRVLRSADGEGVKGVTVDMGRPGIRRLDLPLVDGGRPEEAAIDVPVELGGRPFRMTAVSMGNPHAVIRIDGEDGGSPAILRNLPITEWGPLMENHPWFPARTNTEFVTVDSPQELSLRVWERGSGETLACGTGACAAVVAGVLGGWCQRRAVVHLRGGDLEIEWRAEPDGGVVEMTGAAVEVFRGEIEIPD